MANKFSVVCEGTTVNMNISRKEARQITARLKAQGKKAKVVSGSAVAQPAANQPVGSAYSPAAIVEAKQALQSNDWPGFSGEGEPTDDDARQFINMTRTGIAPHEVAEPVADEPVYPSPAEETMPDGGPIRCKPAEAPHQAAIDAQINAALSPMRQISSLAVGGHFSQSGRFGTYLGPVGMDAKVEFEGRTMIWSNGAMVKPEATPAKVTVAANGAATADTSGFRPGKARNLLFGHPATRVVMWMGSKGYKADQVFKVLAHYGIQSTPASVATFIRSGKAGDRGAVAPLTEQQAAEVAAILS